mmetsp:Transcript_65592/g.154948  ORF Transcript_65592/g.154948 Transcript_65592/m.154948 type:complete len:227 (-) Transcript_65592:33-713(-)
MTIPDNQVLMPMLEGGGWRNELCSVQPTGGKGCGRYVFSLVDAVEEVEEAVVDLTHLTDVADKLGLERLTSLELAPVHKDGGKDRESAEVVDLYRAVAFRKVRRQNDTRPPQPTSSPSHISPETAIQQLQASLRRVRVRSEVASALFVLSSARTKALDAMQRWRRDVTQDGGTKSSVVASELVTQCLLECDGVSGGDEVRAARRAVVADLLKFADEIDQRGQIQPC